MRPGHSYSNSGDKQMESVVLTDDELKPLEKRFGFCVRQMGPWNSDGTFSYSSVPIVAVERAAEALRIPDLTVAIPRLKNTPEPTKPFIELLDTFGNSLIEKIVAAYRECSLKSSGDVCTSAVGNSVVEDDIQP
jgi:hypothetical protein